MLHLCKTVEYVKVDVQTCDKRSESEAHLFCLMLNIVLVGWSSYECSHIEGVQGANVFNNSLQF